MSAKVGVEIVETPEFFLTLPSLGGNLISVYETSKWFSLPRLSSRRELAFFLVLCSQHNGPSCGPCLCSTRLNDNYCT